MLNTIIILLYFSKDFFTLSVVCIVGNFHMFYEFLVGKMYMLYMVSWRATPKPLTGQMWPAGRMLPAPALASFAFITVK